MSAREAGTGAGQAAYADVPAAFSRWCRTDDVSVSDFAILTMWRSTTAAKRAFWTEDHHAVTAAAAAQPAPGDELTAHVAHAEFHQWMAVEGYDWADDSYQAEAFAAGFARSDALRAAYAEQPAPGDTRAQHAGSPDLQDEWKTELIAKVRLLRGTVALRDAEIRQIQKRVAGLRAILLEGDEDDATVRLRALRQIESFGLPADHPAEQPAPGDEVAWLREQVALLQADLADAEAQLARWPRCPAGCSCRIGIDTDPDANECGCDGPCNGGEQAAPESPQPREPAACKCGHWQALHAFSDDVCAVPECGCGEYMRLTAEQPAPGVTVTPPAPATPRHALTSCQQLRQAAAELADEMNASARTVTGTQPDQMPDIADQARAETLAEYASRITSILEAT